MFNVCLKTFQYSGLVFILKMAENAVFLNQCKNGKLSEIILDNINKQIRICVKKLLVRRDIHGVSITFLKILSNKDLSKNRNYSLAAKINSRLY